MREPQFHYDEKSDVMYISFGDPRPCKSTPSRFGVVFRFDEITNEMAGITIMDFKHQTEEADNGTD